MCAEHLQPAWGGRRVGGSGVCECVGGASVTTACVCVRASRLMPELGSNL